MGFKPFLAYSASAGSGKTFALSVRYIALLFMGEAPSSILAQPLPIKQQQRCVREYWTLYVLWMMTVI